MPPRAESVLAASIVALRRVERLLNVGLVRHFRRPLGCVSSVRTGVHRQCDGRVALVECGDFGGQGVVVGPPCGAGVLRDGRGLGLGGVQRKPVRAQLISQLTVMLSPGGDNRAVRR